MKLRSCVFYFNYFFFGWGGYIIPRKRCLPYYRENGWKGVFEYYLARPKEMVHGVLPLSLVTILTCLCFAITGDRYLDGIAGTTVNFIMGWQIINAPVSIFLLFYSFFKTVKFAFKRERLKKKLRLIKSSHSPKIDSNKYEGDNTHGE